MKKTSRGRVVYNRKFHEFSPKDALRVIGRVRWDLWDPGENLQLIIPAVTALCRVGTAQWDRMTTEPKEDILKVIPEVAEAVVKFLVRLAHAIGEKLADWLNL